MKNYFFKFFAFLTLLFSVGVGEMWGYTWTNNYTVYFNKQNCTDFASTPYVRIGNNSDWSNAYPMSIVSGTKYLYSYKKTDGDWSNAEGFSVANNYGWTGNESYKNLDHALYQPTENQSKDNDNWVNNACRIMKQTTYQKYDINADCYIKIDDGDNVSNTEYSCTYYKVNSNNTTSLVSLPTYSITYNSSPSNGSVAVYQYNGSDYNTSLSSGTNTLKPTQLIKIVTTPDAHYVLATLTVTGATADPDGDGSTYYITGNCEITATFAPRWNIKGSMSNDDWATFYPLDFKTGSGYSAEFTLAAHTAYRFKVYDRRTANNGRYFGCSTRDHDYTYVGQTEEVPLSASGNALMLMTTVGGKYTFNWDSTAKTLQIVYPTTIKHPSMDYVYMEKYNNWNSGVYCYLHNWYYDGSNHNLTDGSVDPKIKTSTPVKHEWTGLSYDTAFYTFPILTTYPKFKAAEFLNGSGGASGHATGEMEVTDARKGHYVYWKDDTDGWVWHTIQIYIQLENAGADEGKKGTLGWNVAFNDTALTAKINLPQKSHYDFGGYYTGEGGTGTQIIDATGAWKTGETDYFNASGAWIHAGDTTKLYAKWTKHPYAIDLAVTPNHVSDSDPLTGGTIQIGGETQTEMSAYQDLASAEIRAVPANDAYIFKEWRFSQTESIYDVYVDDNETYSSTSNPIKIRAGHTGTLTAVFQCRYGLVGSRYDDVAAGMPGWVYGDAADFIVKGFTSLGEGADKVDLECARTLGRATSYKFRIYDREKNKLVGCGTDGAVLPAEYKPSEGIYNNWQLNHTDDGFDVNINTLGRGTYTFHITNISNDDNYWPSVQVDRQLSYQVHIGWKHAEAENLSSLSTGNDGGTASVTVDEGDGSVTVANNDWVAKDSRISISASSASSYDFAGWWDGDAYTGGYVWGPGSPIVEWTVSATVNAFAKFVEKTNTFEGDETGHETEWNQTGNWSADHIPTINEVAIIPKQVVVDITDAKAKRVLIKNDSPNNGQIEIPAGKELIVAQTIKQTSDGSTYGATGENDIIIGSTLANGNGALVMGAHDGTNKATVYFATKAKTVEQDEVKHNVNQFIGTPFNDENDILYDYYGTKIYEFKAGQDGNIGNNWWRRLAGTGDKMQGFLGYNILTNQTTEPVLEMTGTLCKAEEHSVNGYYGDEDHREYLFANSWVAPIYIPNFKDDDFTNMDKTIYIFNAGTVADQGEHSTADGTFTNTSPGQYIVIPIKSSEWVGDPTVKVIPSMQAFSVFANDENPKLTFNYTRLVYNPANGTAGIVPNRAPQRTKDADAPSVLRLAATGESGYAAKIVLLERTDFTDGYDDGWDGRFLAGDDAAPQLYAVTSDGNMAINCVPEVEGTVLGFKAGEADEVFTFSFDYDGEALYLYDTQTQTYTRVLTGNTYTFTTNDLAAHNRFILTYNAPQTPTGVENTQELKTVKFIENDHLYIFQNGRLYDAAGRIVK